MKTFRIITALAIAGNLGISIYGYDLHSIIGWCIALGYFCCFELNESQIQNMYESQIRKMRDEK
jgi:hypothetical protein